MTQLLFGTNNAHKLEEIRALVPPRFQVLSAQDLGIELDVEETETTLSGNALLKAAAFAAASGMACFADDTGLEVEALDGAPGVYSARWAGEQANAKDNVAKMLREMADKSNRRAVFRTVIAFVDGDQHHLFEGEVAGSILRETRGENGFGYDPLFVPEGHSMSFAQMRAEEKHALSHRARAVRAFVKFLENMPHEQ